MKRDSAKTVAAGIEMFIDFVTVFGWVGVVLIGARWAIVVLS